ncbi:MAG TPA: hypothetical protein VGX00_00635 [Thermoplasmata archaeon]|nr:hypothetical protein [Thermoplasmata archaeon]
MTLANELKVDRGWPGDIEVAQLEGACMAAIRAAAPVGNPHRDRADEIWEMRGSEGIHSFLVKDQNGRLANVTYPLVGTVVALREEVRRGYMRSFETIVRSETFSDLLEMAEYLLTQGYKDPAAVVAGGVLEEQLRKLGSLYDVSLTERQDWKKSQQLNQDLCSAGAYLSNDQKSVTAWLDIRNDAAHGKYNNYAESRVGLMLSGIRDFISRTTAE